jgi:hypothetical protein
MREKNAYRFCMKLLFYVSSINIVQIVACVVLAEVVKKLRCVEKSKHLGRGP